MKDWQSQAHVKWECKYHSCDISKIPQEGPFWKASRGSWQDTSGSVSTEGHRAGGREGYTGPRPHAAERGLEVQHRDDGGVLEG